MAVYNDDYKKRLAKSKSRRELAFSSPPRPKDLTIAVTKARSWPLLSGLIGGTGSVGGSVAKGLTTRASRSVYPDTPAQSLAEFVLSGGVVRPNSRIARIINRGLKTSTDDIIKRSNTFRKRTGDFIPPEIIKALQEERLMREAKGAADIIRLEPGELTHWISQAAVGNWGARGVFEGSRLFNQLEGINILKRTPTPSVPVFVDDIVENVYSGLPKRGNLPAISGWQGRYSRRAVEEGVTEFLGLPPQSEARYAVQRIIEQVNRNMKRPNN